MKKNKFYLKMALIAAGIFLCSTSAYANAFYNSVSGAALTVGTTGAGNDPAVITYNPSPGVSMGVYATPTAYALNALNVNATLGNRNEYLVISTAAGYYQKQLNTITPLASETPTVTTYTYMGGS